MKAGSSGTADAHGSVAPGSKFVAQSAVKAGISIRRPLRHRRFALSLEPGGTRASPAECRLLPERNQQPAATSECRWQACARLPRATTTDTPQKKRPGKLPGLSEANREEELTGSSWPR